MLLDCFRPGTCERLGIGPDDCAAVNPRLIFARITGWGQDGPLATTAGHDINYLSQTGALSAIGYRDRPPVAPLNLVADFGGGSMFVLLGIVAALYERERSGKGQVIDAAMVDGVSILSQMMWTMKSIGSTGRRARVVPAGRRRAVLPHLRDLRRQVHGRRCDRAAVLRATARRPGPVGRRGAQSVRHRAPTRRCARSSPSGLRARPATNGREIFAGTDACVTPVLTWTEAAQNEHLKARSTLVRANGVEQAAPAPRFSRTPSGPVGAPPKGTTPIDEIGW